MIDDTYKEHEMTKTTKKMTMRDTIRGMYSRAFFGLVSPSMNLKYLARRLNKSVDDALQIVRYMASVGEIQFSQKSKATIEWRF